MKRKRHIMYADDSELKFLYNSTAGLMTQVETYSIGSLPELS